MINIKYDNDNIAIEGYGSEQTYLDEISAEKNEIKRESGDYWAEQWIKNRTSRNQLEFEALFRWLKIL